MVVVAVAAGTGNVGRTITDALKKSPKHKVIVLARKAPEIQDKDVPFFPVEYSNIDAVAKILEENNVETVISAISVLTPESGASEVELVKASAKSTPTKRFIASDWGLQTAPEGIQLPQHKIRPLTLDELRKTDLIWTRFYNGYFLDYYGIPYIETYMHPFTFVADMAHKEAAIPGTGNEPMTLTYTHDLAKFVVAALDLPAWDEVSVCYSERTTWNEFIRTAEDVLGCKFKVTYDSAEKLAKGEITPLPSHELSYAFIPKEVLQSYFSKFGLYIINGMFEVPVEGSLNQKFPEIKTTSVREMVGVWRGK